MKQAKKLLAALMALVMMMSVMATTFAVSAEDAVDPDSNPISGWDVVIDRNGFGGYWNDDLKGHGTGGVKATTSKEYYAPVESINFFYDGALSGYQQMQLHAWVNNTTGYTSLNQFDGICFFVNIGEENKYNVAIRVGGTSGGVYGKGIEVEKGSNQFVYFAWDEFQLIDATADPANGKPQNLDKEMLSSCTEYGIGLELMISGYNTSDTYKPIMDVTISDVYGYKTNGSTNVDEYTFYIPHEDTVKNLPGYFADRIPNPELAAKIDAAYKAALAVKDKPASTATQADVDVIQAFLDLYDSANSGTKDLLARDYGITKDPNADSDSWYMLDAQRQTFVEEIEYKNSLNNQPTPTTPVTVAKAPAKVKKVKAKAKGKKKVVVTWKKAKNAKKYNVKYSYKKNMKKAKTTTVKKLKATLKKLKSGKKVYIQVRGVNGKVKGKWSAKASVKVK